MNQDENLKKEEVIEFQKSQLIELFQESKNSNNFVIGNKKFKIFFSNDKEK